MSERKDLTFREWLKLHEVGTSTAAVAGFKRMALPMRRREMLLGVWGEEDPFFKKKHKKKKS